MASDVYVFGDSHWRVFFPFVNTGDASANISHTEGGVRTIDTIANELSGSTMWGLLNSSSRHGARNRILETIDRLGGISNVALVFGEVDARYHHGRYFVPGQTTLSSGRILELVGRYVKFVQEDLIATGRVRENVFIYHGFSYPKGEHTLLQPGRPIGHENFLAASAVNHLVGQLLGPAFMDIPMVKTIVPSDHVYEMVSDDGVHLDPKMVYERYTLPAMRDRLTGWYE